MAGHIHGKGGLIFPPFLSKKTGIIYLLLVALHLVSSVPLSETQSLYFFSEAFEEEPGAKINTECERECLLFPMMSEKPLALGLSDEDKISFHDAGRELPAYLEDFGICLYESKSVLNRVSMVANRAAGPFGDKMISKSLSSAAIAASFPAMVLPSLLHILVCSLGEALALPSFFSRLVISFEEEQANLLLSSNVLPFQCVLKLANTAGGSIQFLREVKADRTSLFEGREHLFLVLRSCDFFNADIKDWRLLYGKNLTQDMVKKLHKEGGKLCAIQGNVGEDPEKIVGDASSTCNMPYFASKSLITEVNTDLDSYLPINSTLGIDSAFSYTEGILFEEELGLSKMFSKLDDCIFFMNIPNSSGEYKLQQEGKTRSILVLFPGKTLHNPSSLLLEKTFPRLSLLVPEKDLGLPWLGNFFRKKEESRLEDLLKEVGTTFHASVLKECGYPTEFKVIEAEETKHRHLRSCEDSVRRLASEASRDSKALKEKTPHHLLNSLASKQFDVDKVDESTNFINLSRSSSIENVKATSFADYVIPSFATSVKINKVVAASVADEKFFFSLLEDDFTAFNAPSEIFVSATSEGDAQQSSSVRFEALKHLFLSNVPSVFSDGQATDFHVIHSPLKRRLHTASFSDFPLSRSISSSSSSPSSPSISSFPSSPSSLSSWQAANTPLKNFIEDEDPIIESIFQLNSAEKYLPPLTLQSDAEFSKDSVVQKAKNLDVEKEVLFDDALLSALIGSSELGDIASNIDRRFPNNKDFVGEGRDFDFFTARKTDVKVEKSDEDDEKKEVAPSLVSSLFRILGNSIFKQKAAFEDNDEASRSFVEILDSRKPMLKRRLNQNESAFAAQTSSYQLILFCCLMWLSAAFLQWVVSKIPAYAPPISVVWFVFGMILYAFCDALPLRPDEPRLLRNIILQVRRVDSSIIYYLVLPILLYDATQNINWYKFKKVLWGTLSLAVFGVGFQVAILGVAFYFSFLKSEKQAPWEMSFLLASILSSTDPVAVISVLNNVSAPDKLSVLFDGESLINDGSSVLLFQFFFYLISGYNTGTWSSIVMLIRLLFVGPLFGVFLGLLIFIWLSFFRHHHLLQCLVIVTTAYLGYFVAEFFFLISGPLTTVCYGLYVKAYGHIALDREAEKKQRYFVEGLALMANSAIFIIGGIIAFGMISTAFEKENFQLWLNLLLTYIYLNLARLLMIASFSIVLKQTGYGINLKEATLMIWGGLRGGIVLALGLRIEREETIGELLTESLAFYIAGSVLLLLLLNGTTFELLYRLLNPYPPKPFRRVYLEKVMKIIDYEYLGEKETLESHWLLQGTGILRYADEIVPKLGWRKVDALGNLTIKAPDIKRVVTSMKSCEINWPVWSSKMEEASDPKYLQGLYLPQTSYNALSSIVQFTDATSHPKITRNPRTEGSATLPVSPLEETLSPLQPLVRPYTQEFRAKILKNSLQHAGSSQFMHDISAAAVSPLHDQNGVYERLTKTREKHAHDIAAVAQGLKHDSAHALGRSEFDPKFNLRLVERATCDDGRQCSAQFQGSVVGSLIESEAPIFPWDSRRTDTEATIVISLENDAAVASQRKKNKSFTTFSKFMFRRDLDDESLDPAKSKRKSPFTWLFQNFPSIAKYQEKLDAPASTNPSTAPEPHLVATSQLATSSLTNNSLNENLQKEEDKPEANTSADLAFRHEISAASVKSSESFFEYPGTPSGLAMDDPEKSQRTHVLRKEREGELYLMVFNACEEMYSTLFKKGLIGGSCLLSLVTTLERSTDFALGKLRQNPIHAWAEAFKENPEEMAKTLGYKAVANAPPSPLNINGFEFEWITLKSRLNCSQTNWADKLPFNSLRSFFMLPRCISDVEEILAYVEVHEELMERGGANMENLLGKKLCDSYMEQVEKAKEYKMQVYLKYGESFKFALLRVATIMLINLKSKLVKEQALKGLLLEEDKLKILQILEEQRFRLHSYRNFFSFMPKRKGSVA